MFEVTKENYKDFLSWHGRDLEVAKMVVELYDGTAGYHDLLSVRLWVEASKMLLKDHDGT
jgi:hypothetical protein